MEWVISLIIPGFGLKKIISTWLYRLELLTSNTSTVSTTLAVITAALHSFQEVKIGYFIDVLKESPAPT